MPNIVEVPCKSYFLKYMSLIPDCRHLILLKDPLFLITAYNISLIPVFRALILPKDLFLKYMSLIPDCRHLILLEDPVFLITEYPKPLGDTHIYYGLWYSFRKPNKFYDYDWNIDYIYLDF